MSSISGTVFYDADRDGVRDSSESTLASWLVWARTAEGPLAGKSVLADASGRFTISGLAAGKYHLKIASRNGWATTTPALGYFELTLASGQNVTGKNFGKIDKGDLTGTVFNDLDGDAVKETGEPSLSGWRVYLDTDNDSVWDSTERSTLSDAAGKYRFNGVTSGYYAVRNVRPTGWRSSKPTPLLDVSADVTTTFDLANTQKSLISGSVFEDRNGDRIRNGEPGLQGWRVFIDSNGDGIRQATEKSTLTDSYGNWKFTDLIAGTYRVRVELKSSWTRTTPTIGYFSVTIATAATSTGKLFGVRKITS